jgi:DNA-binding NtrC family response regulator
LLRNPDKKAFFKSGHGLFGGVNKKPFIECLSGFELFCYFLTDLLFSPKFRLYTKSFIFLLFFPMKENKEKAMTRLPQMLSSQDFLMDRIKRLEGSQESRLWFFSSSSAMEKVQEGLYFIKKESFKGNSSLRILLSGPSGSALSSYAYAIHQSSSRMHSPWVSFSCSGLTDDQAEAFFFGDASQGLRGVFALAEGGTLFLENIDQLSLYFQKKLSQVLSSGQWKDTNLSESVFFHFQLISSVSELESLSFELSQKLSQVYLQIPSLKERASDVSLFADQYVKKQLFSQGKSFEGFDESVTSFFSSYDWPGNIVELSSFLDMSLSSHKEGKLKMPSCFDEKQMQSESFSSFADMKRSFTDDFEKKYVSSLLSRHSGNVSAAAREAKLDRSNFLRLLRRHGIKSVAFREEQAA